MKLNEYSYEIWEMNYLSLFFIFVNYVQTELAFIDLLLPTRNSLAVIFPMITAFLMFPKITYYFITLLVIVLGGAIASTFFKNRISSALILICISLILII